jgi:hypothetical protein
VREREHLAIGVLAGPSVSVVKEDEVAPGPEYTPDLSKVALDQRLSRKHEVRKRVDAVNEVH